MRKLLIGYRFSESCVIVRQLTDKRTKTMVKADMKFTGIEVP